MVLSTSEISEVLGLDGCVKIAQNILPISCLSRRQRQKILDQVNNKLPEEFSRKALERVKEIFDNRQFYEIAKVPFSEDFPKGALITALADYLLTYQTIKESMTPIYIPSTNSAPSSVIYVL